MLDVLRCPVCGSAFALVGGTLRCASAHSFDIARQGHVALLHGATGGLRADTAEMVAARDRVHQAGVFAPIAEALARQAAASAAIVADESALLVDAGAGGGHYLRAALRACTSGHPRGLGVDLSKYCARAMLRGAPPVSAVVADVWRPLPIADRSAAVVMSVFAPRNVGEFARICRPDGVLLVVRPQPGHLAELIGPMGMLGVDDLKTERLHASLADGFDIVDEQHVSYRVGVGADRIADLAGMGPSAFHLNAEDMVASARRLAADREIEVGVSVTLTVCRPSSPRPGGSAQD